MKRWRLLILAVTVCFCSQPSVLYAETGNAVVAPDTAVAGDFGDWDVTYVVGDGGIKTGGGIKFQFPNGWYSSPWPEGKLKAIQFDNPDENHYVGVHLSRLGSKAQLRLDRQGVDGQHDRFGRSLVVTIQEQPLRAEDLVMLSYHNTTAPTTSEQQKIAIAVDDDGSGTFTPIAEFPTIRIISQQPAELRIIAKSQAAVGEPTTVSVVALDQFLNAAAKYRGTVRLESDDSTATLPSAYRFSQEDGGQKKFSVVFNQTGLHKLKLYDDTSLAPHGLSSNPIDVGQAFSHHNVYWGDLHSHSENSKDGAGGAETAFRYARDVSVLDFYALTDHGAGDWGPDGNYWEGLTEREWQENIALVEKYHAPGTFVTLLACEWSGRAPYGHHNVFFRGLEGVPFGEDQYTKLEEVWTRLQKGEAFTVPHHTGIVWPGGSSPYVDWQAHRNDTLRPAIEIYSLWGSGEFLGNSMSYEHYHLRNFRSHDGRNYARDAWDLGHYVASVAGSDDHNAKPGQAHGGLTAVLAHKLERDTLFDAILERHTYATTGERILLSFTINGHSMGDRFQIAAGASPEIHVRVAGTNKLEFVEVMKFDGSTWKVLHREAPDLQQTEINLTDRAFGRSALYYVRVKQWNIVHNREVRAWSSPIWVTEETDPWWNQTRSTK